MTLQAATIIQDAQIELQDLGGVRWSASDLVSYLNNALTQLVADRPDSTATYAPATLVAGALQNTPTGCMRLMNIPRNTGGRDVTEINRNVLSLWKSNWAASTPQSSTIQHFMFDAREPNTFWVYPPAVAGTSVDMVYSATPQLVSTPSGATYSSVSGTLNVLDVFKPALLDYVLFRAYSKDSEAGGNAQLAAAHFQAYTAAVNSESQTRIAVKPNVGAGAAEP